jgi:hypothetical protein
MVRTRALSLALSLIALISLIAAPSVRTAAAQPVKCSGPGFDDFDFWVGEWTVQWTTPDGRAAQGTNRIRRTLDGCAIVEEFDGQPGSPLKGISVSVYDPRRKLWKQTWVDNHASYLDFEGGPVSEGPARLVLSRSTVIDGKPLRQRMVFRDVTANGLVWDWQRSRDDGATWETSWQLRYVRRAP